MHDRYCIGNILDRVSADLYVIDFPGAVTTTLNGGPNPQGTSVGIYTDTSSVTHGFTLTKKDVFTSFDPPGTGPNGSDASGINPGGFIVGLFADALGVVHGFIRTP